MKPVYPLVSIFADNLTIVLAGGQGERLYPLTKQRAKPAVPFAGSYRLIDFTLSNCVNSGIRKIYILTQYRSTTLDRHIRDGWSLFCSGLGEFIQTVSPQKIMADRWYEGTADAIFHNIHILEEESPRRVLILSGDHIYKMNYGEMLKFHMANQADLTVGGIETNKEEARRFGVLEIDKSNRIISFEEKPSSPKTVPHDNSSCLVSMGIYVFETEKLVRALIEDAKKDTEHDFGKNVVPQMLEKGDRIYCYDFSTQDTRNMSYWRDIGTIDAYWQASMDLTDTTPKFNVYDKSWPIRTYQEQNPPVKIISSEKEGKHGLVLNSLLCHGCIVSQAKVERSILAPQVHINSLAQISESVIMRRVEVGRHTKIRRAIIDEEVVVPEGYEIGCNLKEDATKFTVSAGGVVVVPSQMHLD